jgi:AcrR family transcriptional regulator
MEFMTHTECTAAPEPLHARKPRYHHGDLREALIEAGRRLAEESGAEGVTFAAASRLVGVTATAPYRHFRDRDDFLDQVAARVFDEVGEMLEEVRGAEPGGGAEALIALGKAYVRFHLEHPKLYGLMWGATDGRDENSECARSGKRCFGVLMRAVEDWRAANPDALAPADTIAAPMWMAVHGLASLGCSRAFDEVAPGMTPDRMIELTVPRILEGVKARGARGEI